MKKVFVTLFALSFALSIFAQSNILSSEIERIIGDKPGYELMTQNTKAFSKPGAAEKIARELIDIALEHEK